MVAGTDESAASARWQCDPARSWPGVDDPGGDRHQEEHPVRSRSSRGSAGLCAPVLARPGHPQGGQIHYQSMDHIGNFRVGDIFLVESATGKIKFQSVFQFLQFFSFY